MMNREEINRAFDESLLELVKVLGKSLPWGGMPRAARKGGRRSILARGELKGRLLERLTRAEMTGRVRGDLESNVIRKAIEEERFTEIMGSAAMRKALELDTRTAPKDPAYPGKDGRTGPEVTTNARAAADRGTWDPRRVQRWKDRGGNVQEASTNEVLYKLTERVQEGKFDPLKVVKVESSMNRGEKLPEEFLRKLFS